MNISTITAYSLLPGHVVRVPGPRGGRVEPPHVLTVIDLIDDGLEPKKAWRVDHPPECPVATYWWPEAGDAYAQFYLTDAARQALPDSYPFGALLARSGMLYPGERQCLMQHELDHNGLDSLDGHGFIDHPPDPLDRYPFTPDWQRLPAGRYEILAWHEVGFTGEAYESDGGITVVCRLPKLPKVVLSL